MKPYNKGPGGGSGGVWRTLRRSVRFLAVVGALALAMTGEMDVLYLVVFLSLFLLGLRLGRFRRLAAWAEAAHPYFAGLVFVLSFIDFFFFSESFLLTVAHFLLFLQGLRLLVLRTIRDHFGSTLLSSMMILSAATLAVDWSFLFILCVFLPAVVWTLIVQNIAFENQEVLESQPAAVVSVRERSVVWAKMMTTIRISTLLAFFITGVCCLLVFLVFPRFNFRGYRGQFLQPVRKTGFTSRVNLEGIGQIFTDESVVMRVEINPDDRLHWPGTLRGGTLNSMDGIVWKRTSGKKVRLFAQHHDSFALPVPQERKGWMIHQSIYLESMDTPLLFAAFEPCRVVLNRPFLEVGEDGSLQRSWGDSWRVHYEVESFVAQDQKFHPFRRLGTERMTPEEGVEPALVLTDRRKTGPMKELADRLARGKKGARAKAEAIARYLRENYAYSLNAGGGGDTDPLRRFLFERKQGHCELFASAMCVLLRLQGVPARMVTGFLAHEWNDRGRYYVVRMKDAHAWAEAYLPSAGWVEFDPSPREISEGPSFYPWVRRFKQAMDYLNLEWNRYILSYDFQRQLTIVKGITYRSRRISLGFEKWAAALRSSFDWIGPRRGDLGPRRLRELDWWRITALLSWGIFGLGVGGGIFWGVTRRRDLRAVWFYPTLLSRLEEVGGKKPVTSTLNEFVAQITPDRSGQNSAIPFLTAEYYRYRFGPAHRPTSQETQSIKSALQRLKYELKPSSR